MKLPEEFLSGMKRILKDEYEDFVKSYDEKFCHALRINMLKTTEGADDPRLKTYLDSIKARPVRWADTGFYYEDEERPGLHPYHEIGAYYIQEPSAMFPGTLASKMIRRAIDRHGEVRVLDMCAAPGGKATKAAEVIGPNGMLIANEPIPGRARILSQNIERMGIGNCIVTCEYPERIAEVFPGFFDVVITDVPCSGEGMFRRDEIAVNEWSMDNVDKCVDRSRSILDAAAGCLKPDGCIVFSTCTFEPSENEDMVAEFITQHPEFRIMHVDIDPVSESDEKDGFVSKGRPDICSEPVEGIEDTFRLWPHKLHGEGHFAAVLHKTYTDDDAVSHDKARDWTAGYVYDKKVSRDAVSSFDAFVRTDLTQDSQSVLSGVIYAFGDNLYLGSSDMARIATTTTSSGRIRIERAGLHLGEVRKGRFIPSHALALMLKPQMCVRVENIPVDDLRIGDYMAGESICCDSVHDGYTLVAFDGYSAGWGKAKNGILKNHYPKGLRRPKRRM